MENTVCLDRSLREKIGKNEEIRQLRGECLSGKTTEKTHKSELKVNDGKIYISMEIFERKFDAHLSAKMGLAKFHLWRSHL